MTCPDKIKSPCVGDDINHFSGILPCHHNEAGCHRESTKRKKVFSEMKKLLKYMESLPACEEWDTSATLINTKGSKGPNRVGEYDTTHGKPWDIGRVPSRELIGSVHLPRCDCSKKNGLQDDCRRTQCKGRPWCLSEPWPDCPPFTRVPKEWVEEDPLLMCPNYPKPTYQGKEDVANPRISGEHFVKGCQDGIYAFSEVPQNSLSPELRGGGPLYKMNQGTEDVANPTTSLEHCIRACQGMYASSGVPQKGLSPESREGGPLNKMNQGTEDVANRRISGEHFIKGGQDCMQASSKVPQKGLPPGMQGGAPLYKMDCICNCKVTQMQ